jgi:hypothetical protein
VEVLKLAIGPVLTTLGLVAGYYYFRKNRSYSTRRKTMLFDTKTIKLISSQLGPVDKFEVSYDGKKIKDPQIVEIDISNIGHKDIAKSDFDDGQPLAIDIGASAIAPMEVLTTKSTVSMKYEIDGDCVRLAPGLFPIRKVYRGRLLVEGTPSVSVPEHHIIDTDIVTGSMMRSRNSKRKAMFRRSSYGMLFLGSISFIAASIVADMRHVYMPAIGIVTSPLWFVEWYYPTFVVLLIGASLWLFNIVDDNDVSPADDDDV